MNHEEMLHDQLKRMPRVQPSTGRDTLRRRVLAEVERREERLRRRRRWLRPAFVGMAMVFMIAVFSPWAFQRLGISGTDLGGRQPEVGTLGKEASMESAPAADGESSVSRESGETSAPAAPDAGDGGKAFELARAAEVEYTGSITKKMSHTQALEVEGESEEIAFDRYIFHPYGLQILIPLMADGTKGFGDPAIEQRDHGVAAVFHSKRETFESGQLLLSDITVTAYHDRTPAEVKQDTIAAEEPQAGDFTEMAVAGGERLYFEQTRKDAEGNSYGYVRDVFITEQKGHTFSFEIGRHVETNDGWSPRLTEAVYPGLRITE